MEVNVLLQAVGLTREFRGYKVVHDLSLQLKQGEVLGLLGPNGAGKSTTLQMLTGNLSPTEGQITIKGIDLVDQPKIAKRFIGYLPENPPLYRDLTVNEYLEYCAQLHQIKPKERKALVTQACRRCYLEDVKHRLINNLSKGYQQRIGIAQAILHQPEVVILDEPTVGLDPIQIREIRTLIRELGDSHAVILSTHILPEVQAICDRVQMIDKGKSVFNDSLVNLTGELDKLITLECESEIPTELLQSLPQIQAVQMKGYAKYELSHERGVNVAPLLAELCVKNNIKIKSLTPTTYSLEQVFMSLVHQESGLN
ncbi:ABC transporter ATP-binding protein [Thiofilum flexile]|uniref:ABC transporter ATP-binding protein n=1 Tax=Thiofilum flexile TaxID=125627 RepID=UPI000361CDD5|nr:ABC transporter ATP-binding protein [Thiofilum flexile]